MRTNALMISRLLIYLIVLPIHGFAQHSFLRVFDYGSAAIQRRLLAAPDGGAIILASKTYTDRSMIRIDKCGAVQWEKKLPASLLFSDAIITSSGLVAVCGTNYSSNPSDNLFLCLMDFDGRIYNYREFSIATKRFVIPRITENTPGEFFISSLREYFGGQLIWNTLHVSDTSSVLLAKDYFSTATYGRCAANGKIILNTNVDKTYAIDETGTVLWSNSHKNITDRICILPDSNGFIMSGYQTSNRCVVYKIDNTGTILWTSSAFKTRANSILKKGDDGFLYLATSTEDSLTGLSGVYIVKLDSNGQVLESGAFFYPGKNIKVQDFSLIGNDMLFIGKISDSLSTTEQLFCAKIATPSSCFVYKPVTPVPSDTITSVPILLNPLNLQFQEQNPVISFNDTSIVDSLYCSIGHVSDLSSDHFLCNVEELEISFPPGYVYTFPGTETVNDTTFKITSTGEYFLQAKEECTRDSFLATINVELASSPVAYAPIELVGCSGETFGVNLTEPYIWADGTTTEKAISEKGNYIIKAKNQCGERVDTLWVHFYDCTEIPNVFTPNSDSFNEAFRIKGAEFSKGDIKVFDRWGDLIFEGNINESWNGMKDGKESPEGTYFYEVRYRTNQELIVKRGVVTLLR